MADVYIEIVKNLDYFHPNLVDYFIFASFVFAPPILAGTYLFVSNKLKEKLKGEYNKKNLIEKIQEEDFFSKHI